jgi:hypothetical protein
LLISETIPVNFCAQLLSKITVSVSDFSAVAKSHSSIYEILVYSKGIISLLSISITPYLSPFLAISK